MPFTLTMPKLSPTMDEGTISKWRIKEGDKVNADDVLMEVATDKATVEHNALDEGYIRKILIPEGGVARVNEPIAVFTETADESIEGYEPEGEAPTAPTPEEEAPEEEKKEEAPKAAPAPMGAMQQPAFTPPPPLESYAFEEPTKPIQGRIPASPLARKTAREKGINLATIKGTGPKGRIMSRDLEAIPQGGVVSFSRGMRPSRAPGTFEEEPLSQIRKVIGRRLQESKTFIPHFYVTQEIDAEPMVALHKQFKEGGLRVTYNDFILRASALALKKHPEINSGFNTVNSTLIRYKTIDVAIAVSIPDGLITPIIRHADYKNLGEISTEVRALAKKARDGKLAPEEFTGGSFTISNLGMFGVRDFIAVINPPQAAILAIGGIQEKAVVKNGKVVPGKTMSFTLSSDHRVIDGADAACFLGTLQMFLENPALLVV
ncbi:MAG: Dihydrolipoyllysine-residue acetyltransferase component of pyruvate dehydrogenase complex [Chlamydiae bacterium]|nr:Dihydrolipoyllysine-residue acetyltransferase component of pyruvate dehydrogenase complex [Chlamydiota bacterium]